MKKLPEGCRLPQAQNKEDKQPIEWIRDCAEARIRGDKKSVDEALDSRFVVEPLKIILGIICAIAMFLCIGFFLGNGNRWSLPCTLFVVVMIGSAIGAFFSYRADRTPTIRERLKAELAQAREADPRFAAAGLIVECADRFSTLRQRYLDTFRAVDGRLLEEDDPLAEECHTVLLETSPLILRSVQLFFLKGKRPEDEAKNDSGRYLPHWESLVSFRERFDAQRYLPKLIAAAERAPLPETGEKAA